MELLPKFAEYGLGIFSVACIVVVVFLFINANKEKKEAKDYANDYKSLLSNNQEIMKLNTKVIDNNTKAITELINFLQVSVTRIETKLDELLRR
ncbi:MAG: hypothetical protein ACM3KR_01875 [Deltaproteobacteria bacterium]